ncbi:hypothetical protein HID58_046742, partial [Brassica napus]
PSGPVIPLKWKTPPWNMLKCNIGASWRNDLRTGGASWNILDSQGRESIYRNLLTLEAELGAILCAVDSMRSLKMDRVIIELSSAEAYERVINPHPFQGSCSWTDSISKLLKAGGISYDFENKIANEISRSVTRYLRIQSYVAHGGPSWLLSSIASEAVSNAV